MLAVEHSMAIGANNAEITLLRLLVSLHLRYRLGVVALRNW